MVKIYTAVRQQPLDSPQVPLKLGQISGGRLLIRSEGHSRLGSHSPAPDSLVIARRAASVRGRSSGSAFRKATMTYS